MSRLRYRASFVCCIYRYYKALKSITKAQVLRGASITKVRVTKVHILRNIMNFFMDLEDSRHFSLVVKQCLKVS